MDTRGSVFLSPHPRSPSATRLQIKLHGRTGTPLFSGVHLRLCRASLEQHLCSWHWPCHTPQLSDAPPHPPLPCSTQWRQLGNSTTAFHLGPLPQGAGTPAVTCAHSHPHVPTAAQHPRMKVWLCFNQASRMRYSEEHQASGRCLPSQGSHLVGLSSNKPS